MTEMKYFIARINSPRSDFDIENMTEHEKEVMGKHFQYLKELTKQDKCFLAGRAEDATFGIIIYRTETEEEAKSLINNDPSVKTGVMVYEFREFLLSLLNAKIAASES